MSGLQPTVILFRKLCIKRCYIVGLITKRLQNLTRWRFAGIIGLAALLLLIGSIAYGTTSLFGGDRPLPEKGSPQDGAPKPTHPAETTPSEIAVNSWLVFPLREELAFERAGEVSEILVSEGDRVTQGQLLARLNTDHFPALEEELARLSFQVAEAQDNIKKINLDYRDDPLLAAQREEAVARLEYANTQTKDFFEDIDQNYADALTAATITLSQAKLTLDHAQDDLDEALRDLDANHAQVLAEAFRAKADAKLALDQAIERLADYRNDLSDDSIRAQDQVTEAELALDLAQEQLADYQKDLGDNSIRAQDQVTETELALDLAQEQLADFITDHDQLILRARTLIGAAEDAVDAAQKPLTQFLRSPTRDLEADGKPVDVAKLESLRAAVELAESNLVQAKQDLAELEEGPDPFRLQELESNITVAELNLDQAKDDLAELEEGPDPFRLQELESNITVAELNLTQTKEDLAELEEGPDLLILEQLQAQVDLSQIVLSQAEKFLKEKLEGPDRLIVRSLSLTVELAETRLESAERDVNELVEDGPDRKVVPLREKEIATRLAEIDKLYEKPDTLRLAQIASIRAGITTAQERIDDIQEEMEESLLRAPFDGMIFLLNVEVDDLVNKYSRVIELLDPREVLIEGLVDATDVRFVIAGATARVSIDSLPDRELTGKVANVAQDPSTERGIISYPLTIRVDLPAGLEVPPRLSVVTSVVIPN